MYFIPWLAEDTVYWACSIACFMQAVCECLQQKQLHQLQITVSSFCTTCFFSKTRIANLIMIDAMQQQQLYNRSLL